MKPRRTHPDGTGFVRGLYTFSGLPSHAANFLEREFFDYADNGAYIALCHLLTDDVDFDAEKRSAWSRFIMTLVHRNPEGIERIKQRVDTGYVEFLEELRPRYEAMRQERDPPTFDAFVAKLTGAATQHVAVRVLQQVMDSKMVGTGLNRMFWGVITFKRYRHSLLTSDRPIIMTNGIERLDSHIVVPISPTKLFIAARTKPTLDRLREVLDVYKAGEEVNNQIARQAQKYVWGMNDSQLAFVERRLGNRVRSTPLG